VIFDDYTDVDATSVVGKFACGTELLFYIQSSQFCEGDVHLSSDRSRCHVDQTGPYRWELRWEDWEDQDYDDSVIEITLEPADDP